MIILRWSHEEKPAYADSHDRISTSEPARRVETGLVSAHVRVPPRKEHPVMKCVSALSTARTTNAAFHQVLEQLDAGTGRGARPT